MFRNAIASSSRLPTYITAQATVGTAATFTSTARARIGESSSGQSTASALEDVLPNLPSGSNSTPTPASSPSVSPLPAGTSRVSATSSPSTPSRQRVIPSVTSLTTSSPARSAPTFRWDPLPPIDDTPSTHILTVTSTRNNLLLTLSDRLGPVFPTITAGTGKQFKNASRSGFEAGHQASLKMFERMLQLAREAPVRSSNGVKIRLAYKGYSGQGGEAFTQALGGNEGGEVRRLIVKVEDRTGVKIGGTRPRKPRRL